MSFEIESVQGVSSRFYARMVTQIVIKLKAASIFLRSQN